MCELWTIWKPLLLKMPTSNLSTWIKIVDQKFALHIQKQNTVVCESIRLTREFLSTCHLIAFVFIVWSFPCFVFVCFIFCCCCCVIHNGIYKPLLESDEVDNDLHTEKKIQRRSEENERNIENERQIGRHAVGGICIHFVKFFKCIHLNGPIHMSIRN